MEKADVEFGFWAQAVTATFGISLMVVCVSIAVSMALFAWKEWHTRNDRF